MKHTYTLWILLMLGICSATATAQEKLSAEVESAIEPQDWEEAENGYRTLVKEHIEDAELFFWQNAKEDNPYREKMASILGEYYRNARNYGKAYMFYDELLKLQPKNIDYLIASAEIKAYMGKEEDAIELYERVLSLDRDNLPANIFIGNYYFFHAEKEFATLKSEFAKFRAPTRMQYARYREDMNLLIQSDYAKAKGYLQRVVTLFPSLEVKKILNKIRAIELENEK